MSFLTEGKRTIQLSSEFKDLCDILRPNVSTADVFFITAVLGYMEGEYFTESNYDGPEFRPSYLNEDQQSILYLILFDKFGDDFTNNIQDSDFQKLCIESLKGYANGGLKILYREVLDLNVENGKLLRTHKDYDLDILKFLYDRIDDVPF